MGRRTRLYVGYANQATGVYLPRQINRFVNEIRYGASWRQPGNLMSHSQINLPLHGLFHFFLFCFELLGSWILTSCQPHQVTLERTSLCDLHIYTRFWVIYTSLWVIYTRFWVIYTSLWVIYTHFLVIYTSLWVIYTRFWVIYTSLWVIYTRFWVIYASLSDLHVSEWFTQVSEWFTHVSEWFTQASEWLTHASEWFTHVSDSWKMWPRIHLPSVNGLLTCVSLSVSVCLESVLTFSLVCSAGRMTNLDPGPAFMVVTESSLNVGLELSLHAHAVLFVIPRSGELRTQ